MRSIRFGALAQKSSESSENSVQREQHPLPGDWAGGVFLNLALAAALDVSADAVDVLSL